MIVSVSSELFYLMFSLDFEEKLLCFNLLFKYLLYILYEFLQKPGPVVSKAFSLINGGYVKFKITFTSTGCPKKPPKTIENDLLLEFQCLALN